MGQRMDCRPLPRPLLSRPAVAAGAGGDGTLDGGGIGRQPELLGRFESLGDNCEFGFVQRAHGVESGGLLRWAVAPPEPLLAALRDGFRELYAFWNLVPAHPGMVLDRRYGLSFHTAMRIHLEGEVPVFTDPSAQRAAIHAEEMAKIAHLRAKLLSGLAEGSRIFVYKTNHGLDAGQVAALHAALRQHGPARLLAVLPAAEGHPPGTVRRAGPGLLLGHIERFAPYHRADDLMLGTWTSLCRQALDLLRDEAPAQPAAPAAGAAG